MPWFLWLQAAQAIQAEQDRQRAIAQEAADRQAAANAEAAERARQLAVEASQQKQIDEAKGAQEKAYARLRATLDEKNEAANALQNALDECKRELEAARNRKTPWLPIVAAVGLGLVVLR